MARLSPEPIRFNEEPHLFDFLVRYDIADSEVRGHDSTVKLPNDDEVKLAKAAVPELAEVKSFLAVEIDAILSGSESRARIPLADICSPQPSKRSFHPSTLDLVSSILHDWSLHADIPHTSETGST